MAVASRVVPSAGRRSRWPRASSGSPPGCGPSASPRLHTGSSAGTKTVHSRARPSGFVSSRWCSPARVADGGDGRRVGAGPGRPGAQVSPVASSRGGEAASTEGRRPGRSSRALSRLAWLLPGPGRGCPPRYSPGMARSRGRRRSTRARAAGRGGAPARGGTCRCVGCRPDSSGGRRSRTRGPGMRAPSPLKRTGRAGPRGRAGWPPDAAGAQRRGQGRSAPGGQAAGEEAAAADQDDARGLRSDLSSSAA